MTDRELLEAAAKAAGHDWQWFGEHFSVRDDVDERLFLKWSPLTDDGDALRLAADLDLLFDPKTSRLHSEELATETDQRKAVRRAIVRAAAAMAG